jgi:hypothetical protein
MGSIAPIIRERYYYGILDLDGHLDYFSKDEIYSWAAFFKDKTHCTPLYEAIKAYEMLGYRCVMFRLKNIQKVKTTVQKEKMYANRNIHSKF